MHIEFIRVSHAGWEKMRAEVEAHSPEEACGLLAGEYDGEGYISSKVIPVENILHSPVRYQLDPESQLEAFNLIEKNNWEMVGIYHSHPNGPDRPSPTDIREAYYPESVYLVWSGRTGEWIVSAFLIQNDKVIPIELFVER